MEKLVREGLVAILISSGYGAGWSSWNENDERLIFGKKIAEMVEQDRKEEITAEWIRENCGIDDVYTGGTDNLEIVWLPVGTKFYIEEYDGSEMVIRENRFLIA